MGSKNDGNNKARMNPPKSIDTETINKIKEMVETGSFTKNEQLQYEEIMKAVKNAGGLNSLDKSSLEELNHIIKTLKGKDDKSEMMNGETLDFILSLNNKKHHPQR